MEFRGLVSTLLIPLGACGGGGSKPPTVEPSLVILGHSPAFGAVEVDPLARLSVLLLEEVDPESLGEECIRVEDHVGPRKIALRLDSDRKQVIVTPVDAMPFDAPVQVTVSTALRSVSGTRLATPYTWSFTTRPGQWHDTGTLWGPYEYGWLGAQTNAGMAVAIDGMELWTLRNAIEGWKPFGSVPNSGDALCRLVYFGTAPDDGLIAGLVGQSPQNLAEARGYLTRLTTKDGWSKPHYADSSYDFLGHPTLFMQGHSSGRVIVQTFSSGTWNRTTTGRMLCTPTPDGGFVNASIEGYISRNFPWSAAAAHEDGLCSTTHLSETGDLDHHLIDPSKPYHLVHTIQSRLPASDCGGLSVITQSSEHAMVLLGRNDLGQPRLECYRFRGDTLLSPPQLLWSRANSRLSGLFTRQSRSGQAVVTFVETTTTQKQEWVLGYDPRRDAWSAPRSLAVVPTSGWSHSNVCISDRGEAVVFVAQAASLTGIGSLMYFRHRPETGFTVGNAVPGISTVPPPYVARALIDDRGRMTLLVRLNDSQMNPRTLRYE